MNRRTFLWSVGVIACSAPPRKRQVPRPSARPEDSRTTYSIVDDPIGMRRRDIQTSRSPIAFRRNELVHSTGDELWFWDATTMKRADTIANKYRDFCVLQDGTVAAFHQAAGATHCELHRIDAKRAIEISRGPVYSTQQIARVLAGASPTELYLTLWQDTIALFHFASSTIEEVQRLEIDAAKAHDFVQLTSFGDGRLVVPDGHLLHVLEAGKPITTLETPDQRIMHVAVASNGRLWYSRAAKGGHGLALVRLGEHVAADLRLDLAPQWIVHLASGGGALALLLHTMNPEARHDVWTVMVIDDSGKQRWRADVPADFAGEQFSLDFGFVAISAERVVLLGENHRLLAWDAATGKPIG